jgi:electron transfer flavoprotein beta subunit
MQMIVCIKQVPDPEIPPAKFKVDAMAMRALPPEGIPPVINPYDERAVELALRMRESCGGTITAVTVGAPQSAAVLKHAIAMGADDGVLLSDSSFDIAGNLAYGYILSQAIKKIGAYDLVLCGRQASDWDEGVTGAAVAEHLGLPLVTLAVAVEAQETGLAVKRVTLDGYQRFLVPTPAVLTVSQEVGRPRLPSGRGIIVAARKQLTTWTAQDIGADPAVIGGKAASRRLVKLSAAERTRKCEIVGAESAEEAGARLAERLRQAGAL